MIAPWQILSSTYLGNFRIFRLREDEAVSPRTHEVHNFYILEAPEWINIIPLTPNREVVMVRQYRHGSGTVTLEVPGGMVDPNGESAAGAAARELREETGYIPRKVIHLGSVDPNPAFLNNRCHSYLAMDATLSAAIELDSGEDIDIELVPLADIRGMIANGRITHSLTICAFTFLELFEGA